MAIYKEPIGLYIHVPFCVKKCPYCDFYSVTELSLTDSYTEAVIRNIKAKNIFADTVYFGGGTPSLLSADQIYKILSSVRIANNAEITMECNPNTVNIQYLSDIKSAGINRLSFGVQSLNDNELKALGRIHNAETAIQAILNAEKVKFKNISADIMLAAAYQTKKSVSETLEKLTAMPVTHISAYLLKIEENTPYGNNKELSKLLPSEDETADIYLETVAALENHGLHQYEISNFSLPGFESRHNLKYWQCKEYYGIGPAAHSYLNGIRTACTENLKEFISAETQSEYITDENGGTPEERAMLSLRLTNEGLNLESYPDKEKIKKRAMPLIQAGLMLKKNNSLVLTPQGCLVSNEIICQLLL